MTLQERLDVERRKLEGLNRSYEKAFGAYSWETKDGDSGRKVQNQSLAVLSAEITKTEAKIASLEQQIATGRTGKAFRVGVSWS